MAVEEGLELNSLLEKHLNQSRRNMQLRSDCDVDIHPQ